MPAKTKKPFRDGASRCEIYNEALEFYLYDEAHAPAIATLAALAPGLSGDARRDLRREAAGKGWLCSVELSQDDPVDIEVALGGPLSGEELTRRKGCWMDPQEAWLDLPSGVLRIDTPNTLPEAQGGEPTDPKAFGRFQLPPGPYRAVLQRFDHGGFEGSSGWGGPSFYLSLQAVENLPGEGSGILGVPELGPPAWAGAGRVEGGVFRGQPVRAGMDHEGSVQANLDIPAARALGLHPGATLEVRSKGKAVEATYFGISVEGEGPVRCYGRNPQFPERGGNMAWITRKRGSDLSFLSVLVDQQSRDREVYARDYQTLKALRRVPEVEVRILRPGPPVDLPWLERWGEGPGGPWGEVVQLSPWDAGSETKTPSGTWALLSLPIEALADRLWNVDLGGRSMPLIPVSQAEVSESSATDLLDQPKLVLEEGSRLRVLRDQYRALQRESEALSRRGARYSAEQWEREWQPLSDALSETSRAIKQAFPDGFWMAWSLTHWSGQGGPRVLLVAPLRSTCWPKEHLEPGARVQLRPFR